MPVLDRAGICSYYLDSGTSPGLRDYQFMVKATP